MLMVMLLLLELEIQQVEVVHLLVVVDVIVLPHLVPSQVGVETQHLEVLHL
jgi:hypothetical protein